MLGLQILGIIFGLIMCYFTFLNFKKNELSVQEHTLWQLVWICFIVLVVFPGLAQPIVDKLHFNRTMDLLTVAGFVFLTAVIYNNYITVKKTQRRVEELVRNIAKEEEK